MMDDRTSGGPSRAGRNGGRCDGGGFLTALIASLLGVAVASGPVRAGSEEPAAAREGQRLFYRMIGSARNEPLRPPRTRSILIRHGESRTATTGMALSGFTEYPFCRGLVSYTFAERWAYFPRIVSGAPVDPSGVNTGDILVDSVYEPDACVWGPAAREFTQTFTARGRELVSVTLLVASPAGVFRAELLEGGPTGPRIGPARAFRSGSSLEWGHARWRAGEAPLVAGRTYALRLRREDGEAWSPYLHASGNAYDGGLLFVDGRARPAAELGAWIVEEPPDLSRALVEGTDADGWVYATGRVSFRPRTANVRLVSLALAPVLEKCRDVVVRIWEPGDPPRLLAGPERCTACASPGSFRDAHVLFEPGELDVKPGTRYELEVFTVAHGGEIPTPESTPREPLDIRAWLYGEPEPGGLPAICDLRRRWEGKGNLVLTWKTTSPVPVLVELTRIGPREEFAFRLEPGATTLRVPGLWPGHDHDLRLSAIGPTGLRWRTPRYRLRPPGGPHPPLGPSPYPDHPSEFLRLASVRDSRAARAITWRYRRRVPLANPSFEEGLEGWRTSPAGVITARGAVAGISPPQGDGMAGWSHVGGERREPVLEHSRLWQSVETAPGHEYLVSARLFTSVVNGPRGDARVGFAIDPDGGARFSPADSTQGYWTDGRWLRKEHRFRARAERSDVGFELFRWRDLERSSAFVDQVLLLDLGAAPAELADPPPRGRDPARVALQDSRLESDDRVEAWAAAPPGYVVTGVGSRAAGDNVTTMWLQVRPVGPGGELGEPEEILSGWEPDAGLEARIELPAGWVATGFGARIAPEWDVKTLALWARRLQDGGTLGEEREFRAGIEPEGGLEKRVRLPAGPGDEPRVITGAGLRCALNDVAGLRARSARLAPTAAGAAATGISSSPAPDRSP